MLRHSTALGVARYYLPLSDRLPAASHSLLRLTLANVMVWWRLVVRRQAAQWGGADPSVSGAQGLHDKIARTTVVHVAK